MTVLAYRTALIVDAGSAISAPVAHGLAAAGLKVGLAARNKYLQPNSWRGRSDAALYPSQ
ncbi:MAG: hypothetical protein JO007_04140 [Alphaproteobacteria bacterium]|nr:hypothetical protein [Alphaproteobacteria bacterium]